MGKFSGILLLSDCDGTLTDNRRQISQENQEAIRYFQAGGGLFTVATGRYPAYIRGFHKELTPNAPIIASNGALLYDLQSETVVEAMPLKEHSLERFRQVLACVFEELPTVVQLSLGGLTDSEGEFIRAGQRPADQLPECAIAIQNAVEILQYIDERKPQLLRAFFIQEAEHTYRNMAFLRERFDAYFTIVAGWDRGIECLPKDCGKGKMALRLREKLQNIHTMVAVGDYDNDIDILKVADIGYAVANAPDFVKHHADRVTVSNEKSAIAEIVRDLENSINR